MSMMDEMKVITGLKHRDAKWGKDAKLNEVQLTSVAVASIKPTKNAGVGVKFRVKSIKVLTRAAFYY